MAARIGLIAVLLCAWPLEISAIHDGVLSARWKSRGGAHGGLPMAPAMRAARMGLEMDRVRGGELSRIEFEKKTWLNTPTFAWLNPVIKAGYEHPLEEEELPPLSQEDSSAGHGSALETEWLRVKTEEKAASAAKGEKGTSAAKLDLTLAKAVWNVFGREFVMGGLWKVPHDILSFFAPYLVKSVYKYVDPKGKADTMPTWRRGVIICVGFFLSQLFASLALQQYFDKVFLCSLRVKGAVVAAIFRKALRLSHSSRSEKSLGELVNLMSVDVQRLTDLIPYLHNLMWSSAFQILVSMVLLYRLVGVSSLVGLAVMIAVMPVNGYILVNLRKLQESNMKRKDKRVKTVSEILHSMKVIKMFAWEKPLSARVSEIREKEVARLKTYGYISSLQSIFWNSAPITVSIATFGTYAALGHRLNMETVLPALSVINIMAFPLFVFPLLISAVIGGRVAVQRLTDYMNLPERDVEKITPTDSATAEFPVEMTRGMLGWNTTRPILSNVDLRIKRGTLTAVVGPVGCGKSTLLGALLGDSLVLDGEVKAPRTLAYVPQQAWIQNANVRDNVLFGKEFDQAKYDQALACCALDKDLDKFPGGDETEIGERGVNLSGGQKQRVSIARAVYMDADLYLLDDPISALDAHVGKHVFNECICGVLEGKTRILVTHKLDVLPACDHIIVLGEGGVQAQGTYDELKARGVDLGACCEDIDEEESAAETASPPPAGSAEGLVQQQQQGGDKGRSSSKDKDSSKPAGAAPESKVKRSSSRMQITPEHRKQGALGKDIYLYYLKELRLPALCVCLVIGALSQAARNGNDWWLTRWASAPDGDRVGMYLGIYAAWNLVASLLFLARDVSLMLVELAAASRLHNAMLKSVMRAPMHFFDTTPIGRILNRFSNDQDSLDMMLPRTLNQYYACILKILGTVGIVVISTPTFLLAFVPITWLYHTTKEMFSKTSRELKRIESITKSPLYSHFSETIAGASCIRSAHHEERFMMENSARVDRVNMLYSLINHCNRWLSIRLELCGNLIVTGAAVTGVVSRRMGWLTVDGARLVGLSLTLALAVTNSLSWMVRMSTETEAQMNSVERVAEYVGIQAEEDWLRSPRNHTASVPTHLAHSNEKVEHEAVPLPPGWPDKGELSFDDYSMSYREDSPMVLQGVNLKVQAGEKVGVCGRTGAGKSSLLMALYRMAHVRSGSITLDGIDISQAPLERLRANLAIVPQEPMLFQGSISYNLDPFHEFSDEQKWAALASVQLDRYVRSLPEGMESSVGEGGSSLSVGQRQLLCMARALMRGTKVLVLDEATAAVDHETDALIQRAVREGCKGCTVITIAHRLNTIMDYDKVAVMVDGKVGEFGSPSELLAKSDSVFGELVRSSRITRVNSRGTLSALSEE